MIYRLLEKLHLVHLFGDGVIAYVFIAFTVICGSIVFSLCAKWFLNKMNKYINIKLNYGRVSNV